MLLLFLKKLVLFQIEGMHTLLKFSFQKWALVLHLERSLAGSGEKQQVYAVSMGSIYSCL